MTLDFHKKNYKEDFVNRYVESNEFNKATTLHFAGIKDLLEQVYEDLYCDCGSGCPIGSCKICDNDE